MHSTNSIRSRLDRSVELYYTILPSSRSFKAALLHLPCLFNVTPLSLALYIRFLTLVLLFKSVYLC